MLTTRIDLRKIARARLKDAMVLLNAGRYDGAVYICGYAVECGLKSRICRTLRWEEYPSASKFDNFKTHNLNDLLQLSGVEENIKKECLAEWSDVSNWKSEIRYEPIGKATKKDAISMIEAARTLLKKL